MKKKKKKKIKFIHTSSFRPRRPLQNQLNVEGARCSTGGASEDDDCAEKGLERKARGREGAGAEKGLERDAL
jgi:hypothetical protein